MFVLEVVARELVANPMRGIEETCRKYGFTPTVGDIKEIERIVRDIIRGGQ